MRPNPEGLLHNHIDGSLAVGDVIMDLYRDAGKKFPFRNLHMFLAHMRDRSLPIWQRFQPVTGILQTAEALEQLGYAYGKRRKQEGKKHAEGKFAPQYSCGEGSELTIETATDAMIRGLRMAEKDFGITLYPHVCIGREAEPETGIEVARAALKYDGECALDLACDEKDNPPEKHLAAYRLTFGSNVKRECHAGENEDKSEGELGYRLRLTRNMLTAIFELKCHGISHCIPLADHLTTAMDCNDKNLVDYIAEQNIRVTMCPLSNFEEGHISSIRELGIDELLDRGVLLTLDDDDDLIFPPLSEVLDACEAVYHFTPEQAKALEDNVFKGTFDNRVRT